MSHFGECEQIAELIGAILGDGNFYDKRPYYVEICGSPVNDFRYFTNVLLLQSTSRIEDKKRIPRIGRIQLRSHVQLIGGRQTVSKQVYSSFKRVS